MNGWLSVEEAARICGTDVQRITLWMNGNHIAFARFDNITPLPVGHSEKVALPFQSDRMADVQGSNTPNAFNLK